MDEVIQLAEAPVPSLLNQIQEWTVRCEQVAIRVQREGRWHNIWLSEATDREVAYVFTEWLKPYMEEGNG